MSQQHPIQVTIMNRPRIVASAAPAAQRDQRRKCMNVCRMESAEGIAWRRLHSWQPWPWAEPPQTTIRDPPDPPASRETPIMSEVSIPYLVITQTWERKRPPYICRPPPPPRMQKVPHTCSHFIGKGTWAYGTSFVRGVGEGWDLLPKYFLQLAQKSSGFARIWLFVCASYDYERCCVLCRVRGGGGGVPFREDFSFSFSFEKAWERRCFSHINYYNSRDILNKLLVMILNSWTIIMERTDFRHFCKRIPLPTFSFRRVPSMVTSWIFH